LLKGFLLENVLSGMGNGKNKVKHQGGVKNGLRARATSVAEHQQLY